MVSYRSLWNNLEHNWIHLCQAKLDWNHRVNFLINVPPDLLRLVLTYSTSQQTQPEKMCLGSLLANERAVGLVLSLLKLSEVGSREDRVERELEWQLRNVREGGISAHWLNDKLKPTKARKRRETEWGAPGQARAFIKWHLWANGQANVEQFSAPIKLTWHTLHEIHGNSEPLEHLM